MRAVIVAVVGVQFIRIRLGTLDKLRRVCEQGCQVDRFDRRCRMVLYLSACARASSLRC